MNSKKLFLSLLALSASATAKPLTYPECGKWNFSVSLENGVESSQASYALPQSTPDATIHPHGAAYKISSVQSAGYGKWFYLQSRLSYSKSFTINSVDVSDYHQNNYFDGDLSVFIPVRLSSQHRITLAPQIGCAYMKNQSKRKVIGVADPSILSRLRVSYWAPLVGLALGIEPTQSVAMRFGLNLQFPKGDIHNTNYEGVSKQAECRAQRHAVDAYFNAMYQLSKNFELTGTVEYKSYSVRGSSIGLAGAPGLLSMMGSSRTSATIGGMWSF